MVTLRIVFIAGLSVAAAADGARAGLVVDVFPANPTTVTPVSVTAWFAFGDSGYEFVEANYSITGNQILMDVIMQDLHRPGVAYHQVVTIGSGTVDLGVLAEGSYDVDAAMYMIPWASDEPRFFDSGVGSFDVVPEPGTLCLLVLGGLALVMTRRKPAAA